MKRFNDTRADEPASKRQSITQTKHHRVSHRQPGMRFALQNPQDESIADDQLLKAVAVALYSTGFRGVQLQALQSFHSHVVEYMRHFAVTVQRSMQSSRRSQPLPVDFIRALANEQVTASAFIEDIALPTPVSVTQPPILPYNESPTSVIDLGQSFDSSTIGDAANNKSRRVPKHFPDLPSTHSYKATATFSSSEGDARRVREQATRQGMLAEEALRKLMAANKASRRSGANRRRGKSSSSGMTEKTIWQETVTALLDSESANSNFSNTSLEKKDVQDQTGSTLAVDGDLVIE